MTTNLSRKINSKNQYSNMELELPKVKKTVSTLLEENLEALSNEDLYKKMKKLE